MNNIYWNDGTSLYHHGIPGQKWGVQNGPPYPLDQNDHSKREKREEYQDKFYKKRIDKRRAQKDGRYDRRHFADKQSMDNNRTKSAKSTGLSTTTKALMVIGGIAITAAVVSKLKNKGQEWSDITPPPIPDTWNTDNSITRWVNDLYKNGNIGTNNMVYSAKDAFNKLWSDKWYDEISNAEYAGVRAYTGDWYKDMNTFLRTGHLTDDPLHEKADVLEAIDLATSALKKAELPNDVIVHRGVGSLSSLAKTLGVPEQLLTFGNGNNPKDLIGMDFVDKAFGSTGAVPDAAWGGCKLHICLPKGSQAMFVAPISEYPSEKEVLVNRGAHYVIKDLKMDLDGNVSDLVVELINHIN